MTPKEKLIQWVKDTAQRNYENGGHVIIETYTDEDIEQMIDDGITFKEFFRMLNTWDERYTAIRDTAW